MFPACFITKGHSDRQEPQLPWYNGCFPGSPLTSPLSNEGTQQSWHSLSVSWFPYIYLLI